VGIVWWQLLWVLDFLIHMATGVNTMGMSNYMFDEKFSRVSRGLSLYKVGSRSSSSGRSRASGTTTVPSSCRRWSRGQSSCCRRS